MKRNYYAAWCMYGIDKVYNEYCVPFVYVFNSKHERDEFVKRENAKEGTNLQTEAIDYDEMRKCMRLGAWTIYEPVKG